MTATLSFLSIFQEWLDFDLALGVLGITAAVVTVIAGFVMIFSFFGGGDFDGDAGLAGAEGGLFSIRAIVGFMLGMSWGSFVARSMGSSILVALLIGVGLGLVTFFVIALTMRMLLRMHTDGSFKYESLEGMEATVYLSIPPHGETGGQVQVAHPSQYITIAAIQEGDSTIAAQSKVVILKASSTQVLVKSLF